MTVAGFIRNRRHLFGRQGSFGTIVPATQAHAWSGTPSVNLNWTDPEVDTGSIDITATPYRTASDLTAALSSPRLAYNDLPRMLSGVFGGAVTGTGAGDAQTWSFAPAPDSSDAVDVQTYEFGDDVENDWFQFGDGLLESLELTGPEGKGPVTSSMTWRFGSVGSTGSTDMGESGTVPTPDLAIDPNEAIVYVKDLAVYISSTIAGLASDQISDAVHSATLRITNTIDQKRWANGSQKFDIDAYGRSGRNIELELVLSKTADTVGTGSESDSWMSDDAVTRYCRLLFTSTVLAQTGPDVPYSLEVILALRYYTRAEGAQGGNSTIVLTGRAFNDQSVDGLAGAITAEAVCSLSDI